MGDCPSLFSHGYMQPATPISFDFFGQLLSQIDDPAKLTSPSTQSYDTSPGQTIERVFALQTLQLRLFTFQFNAIAMRQTTNPLHFYNCLQLIIYKL